MIYSEEVLAAINPAFRKHRETENQDAIEKHNAFKAGFEALKADHQIALDARHQVDPGYVIPTKVGDGHHAGWENVD